MSDKEGRRIEREGEKIKERRKPTACQMEEEDGRFTRDYFLGVESKVALIRRCWLECAGAKKIKDEY